MIDKLTTIHQKLFGTAQELRNFFAPGRINLIGEHTDYNGGHVFPCALNNGTYAVVSTRLDQNIHLYSTNFSQDNTIVFSLSEVPIKATSKSWINYPKGMCKIFLDNDYNIPYGLNIVIGGDIPNGAGLSSSASIEMLMAIILNNMYNLNVPPVSMVKWGQQVENNFIGVSCGIMDQFASMMSRKDQALLLNCTTLHYQYAPLELKDYVIIIGNTNKQRTLAGSKYNERVYECQTALQQLQQNIPIENLAQLDEAKYFQYEHLITNPIHRLRAKHIVTENARTLEAANLLKNYDLIGFGQLMNQSHISLRDNYAVTGHELDSLVNAAWQTAGCIGSRMTGAGFGGCTVSLVKQANAQEFIDKVGASYLEATGLRADFYIAGSSDGAREISQ
ncbi:MAG: galactokinase [Burkholderiales bacterium]|nr:galactokinase [Burkholderiales bacterium]